MINAALQSILRCAGMNEDTGNGIRFLGSDPVFRTQYRVGTAGSAALAAVGLAMADIRQLQTGQRPDIEIDVRGATACLRSIKYAQLNGLPPAERSAKVTGFYRAAEGRWIYFHCNHPPHLRALLRVLGVADDRDQVAAAALRWNAFELEQAVDTAGGCAPVVRTPDEWKALPNTPILAAEPPVDIRKIGDSAPIPLPSGERPLSGLRVLDLTRVLAGPTCGRLLAEAGADVLKITCAKHPDSAALELDTGYAKRTATLDLASPEGKAQFTQLMRQCDVFSQAYRPGALAGMGFSQDEVMALRPGIIHASLNAYGYTGPWKGRRGFETVVQSASGMAWITGRGKEPQFVPVSSLDYMTGFLMNFGVLVALKRRHLEGGSYSVNVSLARVCEWLLGMGMLDIDVADTGSEELAEIERWLIEVPTPRGQLKRLRPIIGYSEPLLNELPVWNATTASGAVWAAG